MTIEFCGQTSAIGQRSFLQELVTIPSMLDLIYALRKRIALTKELAN